MTPRDMLDIANRILIESVRKRCYETHKDASGRKTRSIWTYRSDDFSYRIKHFNIEGGRKFFMVVVTPMGRFSIVDYCWGEFKGFSSHRWVRGPTLADEVALALIFAETSFWQPHHDTK